MSWRALYSVAVYALLPFVLLKLWWRGRREPQYRARIGERFGRYAGAGRRGGLWVHAVSLGEARASAPLVQALREETPGLQLILTCTTATGYAALRQMHGESQPIVWLPYDTPGSVRRFLEHFRPRLALLIETEVWPNLLAACARCDVPVVLASARMSAQSAAGYRRWRALSQPAFASLAVVGAQSEADAERLRALGAARVSVCGNLKFDVAPDAAQVAAGRAWRASIGRPVVLLASTRDGEEQPLLDALRALPESALIVVVPRHPQRFAAISELLGGAAGRRSRGDRPQPGQRCYLGDSMGEMAFYYAAADVAVVGGSFVPLGGQNLIEACAVGAPVVFGPSMHNFAEASALALDQGAALQARDAGEAARLIQALLAEEPRRQAMARAGLRLCAAHRGATRKHVAMIQSVLEAR